MRVFCDFSLLECKRWLSARTLMVFLFFLVLALALLQGGIDDYNRIIKDKEDFQRTEQENIKRLLGIDQYGTYGLGILFVPSSVGIFLANSGVVSDMSAFVDSGVRLRIYHSFLGKNLFTERAGAFKDFFGFILLLGSLICLFWGYESLANREYIKFMASILGYAQVFLLFAIVRFLVFSLAFLSTFGSSLLLMRLNGISLTGSDFFFIMILIFIQLLLFLFFFLLGIFCASVRKSKIAGFVTLILVWIFFIIIAPGIISRLLAQKAGNIASVYALEQKKLEVLTGYKRKLEKEIQRHAGPDEQREAEKKMVAAYWDNEFPVIQAHEKKMLQDMEHERDDFQALSSLSPATFYISVQNEVGSKGYENFFRFYRYTQGLQEAFVRFYLGKRTDNKAGSRSIEPFVKGDENIFYARARLPGYFPLGLSMTLLYITGAFILSFLGFRKNLFSLPLNGEGPDPNQLSLDIGRGEAVVLLTTAPSIIDQLYNIFSGMVGDFSGKLTVNGLNVAGEDRKKRSFIYFCPYDRIPGNVVVQDFIRVFRRLVPGKKRAIASLEHWYNDLHPGHKRFYHLKKSDRARLFLYLVFLKSYSIHIIHDFLKGMPVDFVQEFKDRLRKFKDEGDAMLYLTGDVLLASRIGDRVTYFVDDPSLPPYLDSYIHL